MPDILQALLERKDKIAKMPEASQRKMWGLAFSQSVAPQLRAKAASGAQLENEDVSKERFITSMIGKPQPTVAEPTVAPPGLMDKALATVGAAGAGVATGFKNIVSHIPAPEGANLKPMLLDVLGKAESSYPLAQSIAPSAAPVAAAVGHQIPAIMAFEAGAGVVPVLAGGVTAGTKAPLAMRAIQQTLRTGAGTAAMNLTEPGDTSGGKLAAQTIGFSVLDMLAHGFLRKTGTSGLPDAASVLKTVRSSIEKTSGVVNKDTVNVFNNAFLDLVKQENPEAYERITKGEKANDVLSLEDQIRLTNKTASQQQAVEAVAKTNEKTAKIAEKQQAKAASGLEAMRVKAQAQLEKQAQGLKIKALQREISAYAKATGKVPAEGSEAMKSLQNGAKAKEVVAQERASVVQRVAQAKDVNDAIAVTEEAPAVTGMVEDLQALAKPQVETVPKPVEIPTVPTTPKVPKPGSIKAKISEGQKEHAFVKFGVNLDASTMTTPEDVIAAKRGAMEQIQASYNAKIKEITQGVVNKTLTKEQAVAMYAELKLDSTKAATSVMKFKTPEIGRGGRDRLRNRANAAEAKRVIGEQQAGKEVVGTSSAGAEMTEQEAIDEIDTLVKIGFGSAERKAVADKIIAGVKDAGGGAVDLLEELQDAYKGFGKGEAVNTVAKVKKAVPQNLPYSTGRYKLEVSPGSPGYLKSGVYDVEVGKGDAHFRNVATGGATFEKHSMLQRLIKEGRLKFIPVPKAGQ